MTLRNLMTMTSGYEDFAPQDYIIPAWYHPINPLDNVREWAGKPLDFDPGTAWQYSNTNYVLLGLIVQKVSGEPLYKFIRENVLTPLHLEGVFNTYTERDKLQVTGYVSNATAHHGCCRSRLRAGTLAMATWRCLLRPWPHGTWAS